MEGSDSTAATNTGAVPLSSSSPSSSPTSSPPSPSSLLQGPSPPSPPPVVLSPCAACKILRRRCVDKCLLAPYFPPNDPLKFTIAHRVFGASNIIKLLQDLPESHRSDAVSSMVYEANARIRDPVYGCAGAICQLQKQVGDLQAQLAVAQAELFAMQTQHSNLTVLCMEIMAQPFQPAAQLAWDSLAANGGAPPQDGAYFLEEEKEEDGQIPAWEPLWL